MSDNNELCNDDDDNNDKVKQETDLEGNIAGDKNQGGVTSKHKEIIPREDKRPANIITNDEYLKDANKNETDTKKPRKGSLDSPIDKIVFVNLNSSSNKNISENLQSKLTTTQLEATENPPITTQDKPNIQKRPSFLSIIPECQSEGGRSKASPLHLPEKAQRYDSNTILEIDQELEFESIDDTAILKPNGEILENAYDLNCEVIKSEGLPYQTDPMFRRSTSTTPGEETPDYEIQIKATQVDSNQHIDQYHLPISNNNNMDNSHQGLTRVDTQDIYSYPSQNDPSPKTNFDKGMQLKPHSISPKNPKRGALANRLSLKNSLAKNVFGNVEKSIQDICIGGGGGAGLLILNDNENDQVESEYLIPTQIDGDIQNSQTSLNPNNLQDFNKIQMNLEGMPKSDFVNLVIKNLPNTLIEKLSKSTFQKNNNRAGSNPSRASNFSGLDENSINVMLVEAEKEKFEMNSKMTNLSQRIEFLKTALKKNNDQGGLAIHNRQASAILTDNKGGVGSVNSNSSLSPNHCRVSFPLSKQKLNKTNRLTPFNYMMNDMIDETEELSQRSKIYKDKNQNHVDNNVDSNAQLQDGSLKVEKGNQEITVTKQFESVERESIELGKSSLVVQKTMNINQGYLLPQHMDSNSKMNTRNSDNEENRVDTMQDIINDKPPPESHQVESYHEILSPDILKKYNIKNIPRNLDVIEESTQIFPSDTNCNGLHQTEQIIKENNENRENNSDDQTENKIFQIQLQKNSTYTVPNSYRSKLVQDELTKTDINYIGGGLEGSNGTILKSGGGNYGYSNMALASKFTEREENMIRTIEDIHDCQRIQFIENISKKYYNSNISDEYDHYLKHFTNMSALGCFAYKNANVESQGNLKHFLMRPPSIQKNTQNPGLRGSAYSISKEQAQLEQSSLNKSFNKNSLEPDNVKETESSDGKIQTENSEPRDYIFNDNVRPCKQQQDEIINSGKFVENSYSQDLQNSIAENFVPTIASNSPNYEISNPPNYENFTITTIQYQPQKVHYEDSHQQTDNTQEASDKDKENNIQEKYKAAISDAYRKEYMRNMTTQGSLEKLEDSKTSSKLNSAAKKIKSALQRNPIKSRQQAPSHREQQKSAKAEADKLKDKILGPIIGARSKCDVHSEKQKYMNEKILKNKRQNRKDEVLNSVVEYGYKKKCERQSRSYSINHTPKSQNQRNHTQLYEVKKRIEEIRNVRNIRSKIVMNDRFGRSVLDVVGLGRNEKPVQQRAPIRVVGKQNSENSNASKSPSKNVLEKIEKDHMVEKWKNLKLNIIEPCAPDEIQSVDSRLKKQNEENAEIYNQKNQMVNNPVKAKLQEIYSNKNIMDERSRRSSKRKESEYLSMKNSEKRMSEEKTRSLSGKNNWKVIDKAVYKKDLSADQQIHSLYNQKAKDKYEIDVKEVVTINEDIGIVNLKYDDFIYNSNLVNNEQELRPESDEATKKKLTSNT